MSSHDPELILAALEPRLVAAKRSYLRRRLAVLMVVPLLVGGAAWATAQPEPGVSQVAGTVDDETGDDEPTSDATDVDVGVDDDAEIGTGGAEDEAGAEADEADRTSVIALGMFGSATIGEVDGVLTLLATDVDPAWDVQVVGSDESNLVLLLGNGEVLVLATITVDGDGFAVTFQDLTPPGGDTDDEPGDDDKDDHPAPTFETRKEIAVFSAGQVVVERVGDSATLELAIVWTADGYAGTVDTYRGELVQAHFDTDGYRKFVKAWVDGAKIVYDTWYVELEPAQPEYQTRKEIAVFGAGGVVVERIGETNRLVLVVGWTGEGYDAVVDIAEGEVVKAHFVGAEFHKYVEAWTDGPKIEYETWYIEVEAEEPGFQTRKEIDVYDVGSVVVERVGESSTLGLAVSWTHEWYDAVIVSSSGELVHAYFTNDGYEKHVKAWTDGPEIVHETWIVEPELESYSGTVDCSFGSFEVLVEGNIARITSITAVEGVTATILKEVGEYVKVEYRTDTETWHGKAWGNGSEIVSEWYEVE